MCGTMRFMPLLIAIGVLGVVTGAVSKGNKVSCKDESGHDVDWFYLYKLPKHYKPNSLEGGSSGLRYFYITSRQYDAWTLSQLEINDSGSMPALTLNPLFADPTVLLIAYNDQFPNGTFIDTEGHTKGVVATDGETGIWLVHSVPHFPTIPKYEYPSTGTMYGQSFLCLTLPAAEIHKVGEQLIYNEPHIYFNRLPVMLSEKFPNLERAIGRQWKSKAPFKNVVELKTLSGTAFKSFAKSSKYGKDLYEDLVAPTLDANLLVEGWRNGAGNLPSNCSGSDKVYNVAEIKEKEFNLSFKTTSDHSKWAVSQNTGFKLWRWRFFGSDWICVGDINRQAHQLLRGGGTVCQQSTKVTNLYRNLIDSYERC